MIKTNGNVFHIQTKNTSYIIRVDELSHIETVYFGALIDLIDFDISAIIIKNAFAHGTNIIYDEKVNNNKSLDDVPSEIACFGKGDFKDPSFLIKTNKGPTVDLKYDSYVVNKEITPLKTLPYPKNGDEELVITLKDDLLGLVVELHYAIFVSCDVIARNITIKSTKENIELLKVMSMCIDIPNNDYSLINLYGGWIAEANKASQKLVPGIYVNQSICGASSNRRNPFFMLKEIKATEDDGFVYAFNLMYSGSFLSEVELSTYGVVRIMNGINPLGFNYELDINKTFETPFSIMTFSSNGINKASQNMHKFINEHVIPKRFQYSDHPIVINNWEATYFKFNELKLLNIAKKASKLGLEMFVLDDGWFGYREDDTKGLGDYWVNKKKLPSGLASLAKKINKLGLKFGLWMEPESVSIDSDLFRLHPDWIISQEGRTPSFGRHQLLLDLSKEEVVNYLIDSISSVLESANIEYIKWDMNRLMSDIGSFSLNHRYIVGLYKVLSFINEKYPNVMIEGCASGGNRFDLGMLMFCPQIWASDNTDAIQRNIIQSGLYLGYPLSCISNHVSASTSHQLLRKISLDTRFNVACFGVLGYELDLETLNNIDERKIKDQIAFYKLHRKTFQYGELYQYGELLNNNYNSFEVKTNEEAIIGNFNLLQLANPPIGVLKAKGFEDDAFYKVEVRPIEHNIKTFGGLINMISPVHLNPDGFIVSQIAKHKTMKGEKETYLVSGKTLNSGALKLNSEWCGTGFSDNVRLMGDYGSRLYIVTKTHKDN